jgi:hypothetical protein
MKKLFVILILTLLSLSSIAQVPMALNLRIGNSETKGLTGLELQVSKVSISGGWRPESFLCGIKTNSIDLAFTLYGKQWYESGYYITIARASQGMVYEKQISAYGATTQCAIEPSYLFQLGYRINLSDIMEIPELTHRFSIDTGIGWSFSKHANMFEFEVLINFTIFKR